MQCIFLSQILGVLDPYYFHVTPQRYQQNTKTDCSAYFGKNYKFQIESNERTPTLK